MKKLVVLFLLSLVACSAGPDPAPDTESASSGAQPAAPRDASAGQGGVTFNVDLIGGAAEGTYRLSTDDRCTVVTGESAQLNVNAVGQPPTLRYAQISVFDFDPNKGKSGSFIFEARTEAHQLRIDTLPGSIVGNTGTGDVSWKDDGRQIDITLAGASEDGVRVEATITCTAPSRSGSARSTSS
jgi:hypothetical protein